MAKKIILCLNSSLNRTYGILMVLKNRYVLNAGKKALFQSCILLKV